MCNRYNLQYPSATIEFVLAAIKAGFQLEDIDVPARFNVAPQSHIPVVTQSAGKVALRPMVWGLVPAEVRGRPGQKFYPNATREKTRLWTGFRTSAERRRCLIPANGYYEWKDVGGVKYPHYFSLRDGSPFAFAGIWEESDGKVPETVALLTTEPNHLAASVHHRMPVVLPQPLMSRWIGDEPLPDSEFEVLTAPAPDDLLVEREVNRYASNSRHEGPQCLAPPDPAAQDPQMELL